MIEYLPVLLQKLDEAACERKHRRRQIYFRHLLSPSGKLSDDEKVCRILNEPQLSLSTQEILFRALSVLGEMGDDGTALPLAGLSRRYLADGAMPDSFYRNFCRLLVDVLAEEITVLRNLINVVIDNWSAGGEDYLRIGVGMPNRVFLYSQPAKTIETTMSYDELFQALRSLRTHGFAYEGATMNSRGVHTPTTRNIAEVSHMMLLRLRVLLE